MVIGSGIAGAAVACRLAADLEVTLVEREATPGLHATGRSAAMLNETSGDPVVCALATASRPFLADPPPELGLAVPLLGPRGLLWVGGHGTDHRLDALVAKAPWAAHRVDPAGARALVPSLAEGAVAAGGVHEPGAMTIDVAALLDGYLRAFRAAGGDLRLSAEVARCTRTGGPGGGWLVEAGPHRITAPLVVNAAGAWADVVAAGAGLSPLGLQPMRRTAALASAPPEVAAWPMVMDVDGRWYAEPETGGLLISPADEAPVDPGDPRPEEIDVARAIDLVNEALGLELRRVQRAWAGLRTFTPDRIPVAGPHPDDPSFVWLVGQGGSGIKTSPALAVVVHDLVVGGRAVPDDLSPARLL